MTPEQILALTPAQARDFVSILKPEVDKLRISYGHTGTKQYETYLRVYGQLFGMSLHAGLHDHELINKNGYFQGMQKVYASREKIVKGF